jgi:hypothetical protein
MSQTVQGVREPCRLARVGPYRARWDRSLLPELRTAAAVHHSRHRRHRRSQQELALVRGDSHYCRTRAAVAASNVPRLHPRLRQAQPSPASRRHPWARRRALHHHQPSKGVARRSTRSVLAPREKPHRRHGVPDPVPACSRWQANQLPAHRLQLAAAQLEARRTEALAPAAATFETIRLTFVKIAARFAELKVVIKLPSRRHACGDDGRNHDAGPMIDTARAAARSHFNHKPRSDCRGGALFRRRARPTMMADRRGGGPCV